MSKRRLSQKTAEDIGKQRIDRLIYLSEEALRSGKADRARRYVDLAERIGRKTRVRMPKDKPYCKECRTLLIPGYSCRVRLTGGRMTITCDACGSIRRRPYLKEQRII